jgi:hypothetical protein
MRTRFWLVGLVLLGLSVAWEPAAARAAIWPFSLLGGKKAPVKRPRPKPGKPRPGARPGHGR